MLVFVYGTLKRGYSNHSLLSSSEYLGAYSTATSNFSLYCNGKYPLLVRSLSADTNVHGELYRVDEDTLKKLDWLECVDEGMYSRLPIYVENEAGGLVAEAYFYNYPITSLTQVKSGKWNGPEKKATTGHYRNCL